MHDYVHTGCALVSGCTYVALLPLQHIRRHVLLAHRHAHCLQLEYPEHCQVLLQREHTEELGNNRITELVCHWL